MNLLKEENKILIHYCTSCLSLKIQILNIEEDETIDYCADCSNTSIEQANIFNWEKMYIEKYGKKYLEIKNKKK